MALASAMAASKTTLFTFLAVGLPAARGCGFGSFADLVGIEEICASLHATTEQCRQLNQRRGPAAPNRVHAYRERGRRARAQLRVPLHSRGLSQRLERSIAGRSVHAHERDHPAPGDRGSHHCHQRCALPPMPATPLPVLRTALAQHSFPVPQQTPLAKEPCTSSWLECLPPGFPARLQSRARIQRMQRSPSSRR